MSATISKALSTLNKPWTLDEAITAFLASPEDVYLNFVLLQLAKKEGRDHEASGIINSRVALARRNQPGRGDLRQVNLLSLLAGHTGIQECLQMEAMRDHFGLSERNSRVSGMPAASDPTTLRLSSEQDFSPSPVEVRVPFSSLAAPDQKSHPWTEMLKKAEKKSSSSNLSKLIPPTFLLAESRSARRLLETMETICEWGDAISRSLEKKSSANQSVKRVIAQLGLGKFLQQESVLDSVESALASSDLFIGEGNDISILLRFKTEEARVVYENTLAEKQIEKKHCHHLRHYDEIQLGGYTSYSARIDDETYICSNSQRALRKILDCCDHADGMGYTDEFKYIRTLMPEADGADEVLLYFSDPFIHYLVSPQLRITEHRRISCLANLRLLEFSILLFRTQHGRNPLSLAELSEKHCLPSAPNQGKLTCPCEGTYVLRNESEEAEMAVPNCSAHGSSALLTPCIDFDYTHATELESSEYTQFVNEYNRYWQTYFDPIGIRFSFDHNKKSKSVETIILPLMQNSIYSGLASIIRQAAPAELEDPIIPAANIFSAAFRFDPEVVKDAMRSNHQASMYANVVDSQIEALNYRNFLLNGIDKQIGFHVIDSEPPFTLDFSRLLGMAMGSMSASNRGGFGSNPLVLAAAFVLTAINSPVYLSIPVLSEELVDKFCRDFLALLVNVCHPSQLFGSDPYSYQLDDGTPAYCVTITALAATFRLHWARLGSRLIIASKQSVLVQLAEAAKDLSKRDAIEYSSGSLSAHASVRLRQGNWSRIKADLDAAAAENNRAICFSNLGPLSNIVRAGLSAKANEKFVCPCGGTYEFDANELKCSVHNIRRNPQQGSKNAIQRIRALSAQLAFLEDGLHAKLTMDI